MATYKVIQDIEAEDKFVGPLTLKQFMFAMGGMFFGYLSFFAATRGMFFLLIFFLPPTLLGLFLAVPWSKDQPTELWVLAKLRFHFKSKKKVWDQSGLQDLVTVTAPKKIEKALTKDLTQSEVKSRLKALADTIDSRGWAVKNSTFSDSHQDTTSDRLISPSNLPSNVPDTDLASIPDVLDEENGAMPTNIEHLIETKEEERRAQIIEKMEKIRNGEDFTTESGIVITEKNVIAPAPEQSLPPLQPYSSTLDQQQLSKQLQAKNVVIEQAKSRVIAVENSQSTKPTAQTSLQTDTEKAQASMTTPVRADIIDAARNNDLDVATIGRQLSENNNEVIVSLH